MNPALYHHWYGGGANAHHYAQAAVRQQRGSVAAVLSAIGITANGTDPAESVGLSVREVRLESRLSATCAAVEGLTDPRNVLDEDDQHIILRREALERARGVARRNKRDLESGDI